MKYGHLELHIEELLKEKGISKNTICKDLDIPRSNFNRYCRNEFQRLDAQLICKLCSYLDCSIGELIEYVRDRKPVELMKIHAGFLLYKNTYNKGDYSPPPISFFYYATFE